MNFVYAFSVISFQLNGKSEYIYTYIYIYKMFARIKLRFALNECIEENSKILKNDVVIRTSRCNNISTTFDEDDYGDDCRKFNYKISHDNKIDTYDILPKILAYLKTDPKADSIIDDQIVLVLNAFFKMYFLRKKIEDYIIDLNLCDNLYNRQINPYNNNYYGKNCKDVRVDYNSAAIESYNANKIILIEIFNRLNNNTNNAYLSENLSFQLKIFNGPRGGRRHTYKRKATTTKRKAATMKRKKRF